jgi:hypothetical protein
MAQYLMLIYEDEARWAQAAPEIAEQVMKQHDEFVATYRPILRGGHALQPTSTATSLRRQASGGLAVTDGAFVETKEAVGGYYVVEAADLDEAMAVAKDIPAPFGGVEIRPVREFS